MMPRGFGCHIGAGGEGDAYVGACQRGSVIDAVADHRNDFAVVFKFLHRTVLILRQHLRTHRGDACLTGNQIGSACVVAGDHHRFNAHLVELGNRFLRVRSDGVRKGNHPPDIVRLPPDRWQYSRRAQWC